MANDRPPPAHDIERYRVAIKRYIRYLMKNAAEADDLVQEVFMRAHQQQGMLRDALALESWLYQIATHIAIDRMRRRARSAKRLVDKPAEELPVVDHKPSALTIVGQREMSACVNEHVARLTDGYKAVLLLHDADGLTAVEIGEVLGLPVSTVKMRLHRARRQLQAALGGACAFSRDERGVFVCEPKPKPR